MADQPPHGATAVITHRVRAQQHGDYEHWLTRILPLVTAAPGFIDVQLIRPVPGLTDTYTIVLRFDSDAHLRGWLGSAERRQLIDTVTPILAQGDFYSIHTGLDFLFAPQEHGARVPVRWKQFLVTWSAILPLTLVLPLLAGWPLRWLGINNHFMLMTVVSGLAVLLMVYVIMPRYTKLVRRWLYR
jgi:antibiotic biosynthesis monooxygenase (ABM) superfamily enzyme